MTLETTFERRFDDVWCDATTRRTDRSSRLIFFSQNDLSNKNNNDDDNNDDETEMTISSSFGTFYLTRHGCRQLEKRQLAFESRTTWRRRPVEVVPAVGRRQDVLTDVVQVVRDVFVVLSPVVAQQICTFLLASEIRSSFIKT